LRTALSDMAGLLVGIVVGHKGVEAVSALGERLSFDVATKEEPPKRLLFSGSSAGGQGVCHGDLHGMTASCAIS
jgi:hypothetical protein